MKLKLSSSLSDAEVARRLANLRRFRDEATFAAVADMVEGHNVFADAMGTESEVTARAVVDMVSAASKAERIVIAKVTAEAIADLHTAKTQPPLHPVRMIADRLPDSGGRGHGRKEVRFRVTSEDGTPLVKSTTHPFADGAAVLWMVHGLPDATPVSLRFTGMVYDRHGPMRLDAAAAHGVKRLEDRTRLRETTGEGASA